MEPTVEHIYNYTVSECNTYFTILYLEYLSTYSLRSVDTHLFVYTHTHLSVSRTIVRLRLGGSIRTLHDQEERMHRLSNQPCMPRNGSA